MLTIFAEAGGCVLLWPALRCIEKPSGVSFVMEGRNVSQDFLRKVARASSSETLPKLGIFKPHFSMFG